MKTKLIFKGALMLLALVLMYTGTQAQGMQRKSPHLTAKGTVGLANVSITYGSPYIKGRTIWGGLVPYGKPWRAGADEATTLETDKAIKFEGKEVPAGKYTLFITPTKTSWTIILNSQTGQWGINRNGDANFDPAKNVASVTVKPAKTSSKVDQLTYAVTGKGITISWDQLQGLISVQ